MENESQELSSCDWIRILFTTIVFFFVEMHFARATFLSDTPPFRYPLFNTDLADMPNLYRGMELIYVCLMVLFAWRRFVIPAGIAAAIVNFTLLNLDLRDRFQFDYLPGWAFLAFAISEAMVRSEKHKDHSDLPFVILLASIFDFSVVHKVLNFSHMLTDLPGEVFQQSDGFFGPLCTGPNCLILKMVTWGTIPIEVTLGVLMMSRRWLRLRLVVAVMFHWMVAIMAEVIAVSAMLMVLQLAIAMIQSPKTDVMKDRRWLWLIVPQAIWFIGAHYAWMAVPAEYGEMAVKICWVNEYLFPIMYFMWPFVREAPSVGATAKGKSKTPVPLPPNMWALGLPTRGVAFFKPQVILEWFVIGYIGINVIFGFIPLMLTEPYSVYDIGWGMFSGGYLQNPAHIMRTPNTDCFKVPPVPGLIFSKVDGDHLLFFAKRELDLDRMRVLLTQYRGCPAGQIEIKSVNRDQ